MYIRETQIINALQCVFNYIEYTENNISMPLIFFKYIFQGKIRKQYNGHHEQTLYRKEN